MEGDLSVFERGMVVGARRLEDFKNIAWSESQFLLRHSDGRVRIWRKEHESMDPSLHALSQLLGTLWALSTS